MNSPSCHAHASAAIPPRFLRKGKSFARLGGVSRACFGTAICDRTPISPLESGMSVRDAGAVSRTSFRLLQRRNRLLSRAGIARLVEERAP